MASLREAKIKVGCCRHKNNSYLKNKVAEANAMLRTFNPSHFIIRQLNSQITYDNSDKN